MFGWRPKITKATLPETGNSVAIYADCTGSMQFADGHPNMVAAISSIWPIKNARLFGYTDDASSIYEVNHPNQLYCTNDGTSFAPILQHAENINAEMTLIFSDGIPSDESEMWRVWNKTAYPIATHLIMPIGWLTENEASVALMRALCRGGGRFTCGDTVAELKSGVVTAMAKEPMPYVATARRLPDVSRQVFNGADAAKNHAAVNDRVVELGDEVADVQADVFELQQRQIITDTFNQIISGSDAVAVEAIGVQRERAAVDKESRENASAALTNGLAKLGACILGAVGVGIENRLLASESARQRPAEHAAAPQIGGVTINRELLNRTAAISLARANKTAALPPPSMEPVERPARSKAPAIQAPPSQKPLALSPPHVAASARPLPTSAVIVRKRIFNNAEE